MWCNTCTTHFTIKQSTYFFTNIIRSPTDNIYEFKITTNMTTNLTYNHLLEWDKYDLIDHILDLQNEIKELTK